jgi:hypothetical protein
MPIFAGTVLIGFLVFLGFAMAGAKSEQSKPTTTTVAEFGSPKDPIVVTSSYVPPRPATGGVGGGSKGTPFSNQPTGGSSARASAPPSRVSTPSQAVATAEGGGISASLNISAGRFRVSRTPEGRYILYGEGDLDNSGGEPLKDCHFTLTVNDTPIILSVYSGDIYRPKYVISPAIPPGKSTVFLINTEVSGKVLEGGRRSLSVDGKNSNGPLTSAILLEP